MVTLMGLWVRHSNNLSLACTSIQPVLEVEKPDLKQGFGLICNNSLCQILVVGLWSKSLIWKLGLRVVRVAGNSLQGSVLVLQTLGTKRVVGDDIPDVLQFSTSSPPSLFVVQIGTLSQYLDQWRSITSNRFVLDMIQGHHLQLRCHPLLFCQYKWFTINTATAYHPAIQNEVS